MHVLTGYCAVLSLTFLVFIQLLNSIIQVKIVVIRNYQSCYVLHLILHSSYWGYSQCSVLQELLVKSLTLQV